MENSVFEELRGKKQQLLTIAQKAAEYGWIPKEKSAKKDKKNDFISYEEIVDKLNNDTLTIGVIGQMKCGKSTFLNSFVFEDDILPAATTPMTAALSVITYGEKEKIVAEFYTKDEWAEQQQQAARSLDEVTDSLDESKVKAAKELVSKSSKLGNSLNSLLGKSQEDDFSNLIEYVGADGKYISITKSVTIYYPKEYLKGVEIVDTPGFNDPIVSREERTKEFLKKADVVLMMLYAGRPFDATDRDIIFKNVRQCGIGKVLVGINKYDIPYCNEKNPEDENQIKDYVKSEIRKACVACNDSTLIEILNDIEPIPLSAEMALLSELPMSKISSIESFDFAWKKHCKDFGISSQREMRQWSHLDELIDAVKNIIKKEKDSILFAKPLNAIIAAGEKHKNDMERELGLLGNQIQLLSLPDTDIDEREESLSKCNRRMNKKINSLGDDLDSDIQNLVRKGRIELEDIVDSACRNLTNIIDNEWGRFKSFDSIKPKIDNVLQKLLTRDLKREALNLADEGKHKIDISIGEFFNDVEDLLMRNIPEFDTREFVKSTRKKVNMEMESSDLFSFDNTEEEEEFSWVGLFGTVIDNFLTGYTFGGWALARNAITHGDVKKDALAWVNSISSNFDPDPYLMSAFASKDSTIEMVKQAFITGLMEPLQKQIQDIKDKKSNKENELSAAKDKLQQLVIKKQNFIEQYEEIENMKVELR